MEFSIGITGKPNAGKSTLFSSLTETVVAIGDYPFTTVEANKGIAYLREKCPHTELGKQCNPRRGRCLNGIRYIPVEVMDVPGLIEGASQGKGMGNQFMDSLREASALINLISPVTDEKKLMTLDEIKQSAEEVENEIFLWFSSRFGSDWERFSKKVSHLSIPNEEKILMKASFFGIGLKEVRKILSITKMNDNVSIWGDDEIMEFTRAVLKIIRPIKRVVNKGDLLENTREIKAQGFHVISADYELSIMKAFKSGIIKDMNSLEPSEKANERQREALYLIRKSYESGKLERISDVISGIVKTDLQKIVVFPVYDENKWTDKEGNVLPDAFLMDQGDTAEDLAFRIHTDIGNGFIRAINGRTKMILGRSYLLKDGDVIRIVAKT
ncbi:GTPase [Cuniculiplasma sp. SKW4]|uniref:GTPase n=1 Tax=Cuniculiplasma sp. SKW4 TaxID=3400171 RepID=UPI003FD19318